MKGLVLSTPILLSWPILRLFTIQQDLWRIC